MKSKIVAVAFFLASAPALFGGQAPSQARNLFTRQYREGETLVYAMHGVNESWHYSLRAEGTVKKDPAGAYFEEYRWTDMISDGEPFPLPPESQAFRQRVSLDPDIPMAVPDLSKVDPKLIGPITDLMTFSADLWLAVKTGQLTKAGDHFYVPNGTPSSWADGSHVLVGESAIDFDMTLKSVDAASQTAVLVVRHVPPAKPQVHLGAAWMQAPVGDTLNNWVLVAKTPAGSYFASAGQETFTVELHVSLGDGKILSGSMDNSVKTVGRACVDQALTQCGPPQPHAINRKIEIALEPQPK
jgi:hypothetical protein